MSYPLPPFAAVYVKVYVNLAGDGIEFVNKCLSCPNGAVACAPLGPDRFDQR